MTLELKQVAKTVGAETHLYPLDLTLAAGGINVLLGPTQAGKTSLMRIIAGLDKPTGGRILVDGQDVTGVGVRERNLAMVYQQFINYPGLSVFENIASPLRLQKKPQQEIRQRVTEIAEKLHIAHLLQRLPGELSGGQQQRTALARALIKRAPLVLLDEPLVNLDYKLREELRSELISLFTGGGTTVVYATTEPQEALLLGGYTAVMHEGRLLQFAPTLELFNAPASTEVAAIFNDPPMNLLEATAIAAGGEAAVRMDDGSVLDIAGRGLRLAEGQRCKVGIRCNDVRLQPLAGPGVSLACRVALAELSGSETYMHLRHGEVPLVAQLPGVHEFEIGSTVKVSIGAAQVFLFDTEGRLLSAPTEAH
ncbi:ABC transporter ATP-binding protein [Herbaspirillum sp. WKF16]|uniref:ABC transporter ATP-binding protein n=1 Tax=Herbaspirillum sp. WKF16 TaxID=3028312 RepID=UPI0023A99F74|nr:ABC transporter ATP-binding protein [Herbaspirillum sp. WKF16]WDZ96973.1 ABC transporter ATP-binding protein [Herbaspirillum sp. WKF16]